MNSSSVIPFSSHLQSFPGSGSFQMGQLFASGGQNIGVSASTSVLPVNNQDSFRMDWLDLLAVQGTFKSLPQHHSSKASILRRSAFFVNFQMFKLVLEKAEEPEIKLPTSAGSWKKQESSRKTSISALLTMSKSLTMWTTINCGKF